MENSTKKYCRKNKKQYNFHHENPQEVNTSDSNYHSGLHKVRPSLKCKKQKKGQKGKLK